MSWLNFNDSLNSIKGQISSFANNVLAENEGQELSPSEHQDLKELCQQQELEIKKLRELNEELKHQKNLPDGSNGSWNWDGGEETATKESTESISTLKKNIALLETEKAELLTQLEQLDADNQENLVNIMQMKEKLQFELNDLDEKHLKVKQENKILLNKEEKLLNELKKLKEKDKTNKNFPETNQKLYHEIEELKNELLVIKSANENFQKIIEDTNKAGGDASNDKIKKIESENKLLYSELKKATEQIKFFEKKALEDEDDCNKLANILSTYEEQVSSLKKEIQEFTIKYEEAQKQQRKVEALVSHLKIENENAQKKYDSDLNALQEQLNSLKLHSNQNKNSEEIERYKREIHQLQKLNEDLLIQAAARMDRDLEDELEKMKEEHERQLKILREELHQLQNQENKNLEGSNVLTEEIETYKSEIQELKKLNEDLLVQAAGRMDRDLENELEKIQEEHEAQLKVLREALQQLQNQEGSNVLTEEIESYKHEIEKLKKLNEDLLVQAAERMDKDLEDELEKMKEEHEVQLKMLREQLQLLQNKENKNLTGKYFEELNLQGEEIESYKQEIGKLKTLNEELLVQAAGRMDRDLEDELEKMQEEHETQLNVLREELEQLENQENKNLTDGKQFEELEEQNIEISRELKDMQQQCEYLQDSHKISLQELHNRYINIITENIKKFQECEKPSDFEHCVYEDDPHVAELSRHIENIIKILLDLKWKCTDLEKRILEASEEKKNILLEKNYEIEKLIRNSDMLSQEIVSKNQTIKDYENECTDIAKNNELLINELETYKNNPGLQTISESNEDSMILLESQLENANKRIEDLEKVIDDLEKQRRKQSIESENSDLENALEQLNNVETEINNKRKDYEALLNNFDQLQIHYESLRKELAENKESVAVSNEENSNLQSALEKLKAEYEMLEYQVSEMNVNSEGLKEETEDFKFKFKVLLSENSNLKIQNEENLQKCLNYEHQINILHEKISAYEIDKKNIESQMENLTEKLKNCKMAETSLKLQYEQKNKELAAQTEARYNLELSLKKINADLAEFQNNFVELQTQNDKLQVEYDQLKESSLIKDEKQKELENLIKELQERINSSSKIEECVEATTKSEVKEQVHSSTTELLENEDYSKLKQILDETVLEKANLHAELTKLALVQSQLKEATDKGAILHQQLQEVTNSRNELINMVTMKHQENVTYHNEIQRLNQVLTAEVEKYRNLEKEFHEASSNNIEEKNKEIEKLSDQNSFLKEKCEVIAKNLLEEQSKVQQLLSERSTPSEKEITLQKNLDRLQAHLIELEEHYTQELFEAEKKNQSLKSRVTEIEEREKSSSTMYTSVSIRANQQVESLQSQLQTVIQERDSLRKQISDAEDDITKQSAALANLQFVLEQFRKDKEQDVIKETERIRRHIHTEKQVQEDLKVEISNLKSQLEERNQGLLAASRLSDQLESSKKTISGLKKEVSQLQAKLSKTEEELTNLTSNPDGKVDKLLIKNLILGYVTSNTSMSRDQTQILKIIATVLDFNQQDHDKVKLNKPQQGWLASFLAPQHDSQNKMTEESLSRAFIKFLESESKPRVVPSLLNNSSTLSESSSTATNSRSTTPSQPMSQTPIVLSEIVLPTFTDFAQNRNSSSILKDVLKDNS